MINFIFRNKMSFIATFLLLLLFSTIIVSVAYIYELNKQLKIILFIIFLIWFTILFVWKYYRILIDYIKAKCDVKVRSQLEVSIFRYRFLINIILWSGVAYFLYYYIKADTDNSFNFFLGGISNISLLIIFGCFCYYTTTKRFIIDFRPKIKRRSKKHIGNNREIERIQLSQENKIIDVLENKHFLKSYFKEFEKYDQIMTLPEMVNYLKKIGDDFNNAPKCDKASLLITLKNKGYLNVKNKTELKEIASHLWDIKRIMNNADEKHNLKLFAFIPQPNELK